MKSVLQILSFLFAGICFGQKLPKNPVPGKCYEKCFDFEAKIEWREVHCDSLKLRTAGENFVIKGEEAVDIIKKKIKFEKYQEKLIKLGYDLKVTGCIDDKTVEAHHRYLKDKSKAEKVEFKRLKKK
ncbi:hypothetical protein ACFQ1Q_08665 [Winogradskyella litorisediminis]|uniref:Uncharacterized protein n=1 Tax=Winogradskyella litorisediminis TaxID=1156618 RepID=A0ABW3N6L4_9FLAO